MTEISDRRILQRNGVCWRVETARRAKVLIDACSYYGALRESLKEARRSIFIAGWDIDSRTRLVGPSGRADDGLPERLGPFLTELVARRPELRFHILLWDFSMLYAGERESLPSVNLDWKTPAQISVCLDSELPVGASHHQKIVAVDDGVAFCGGLDLTVRRWDTPEHRISDDRRVDPNGELYRPFHDIQMLVDGGAARSVAEIVRRRWNVAACERPDIIEPDNDPWPEELEPDFEDVEIGIARTLPAYDGRREIREVEGSYIEAIEAAEKSIYIENQFLTVDGIAHALAEKMQANPEFEVLIVAPNVHHTWLEEHSMNSGRRRFMAQLKEVARNRLRLVYPAMPDDDTGEGVMVHAKCLIVDDKLLRVGSANLNNRSMGTDSECDLILEARTSAHREKVAGIRDRLIGEHLGADSSAVGEAVKKYGSLLAAVDELTGGDRTLRPIDLKDVPENEITNAVSLLADPERPIEVPAFVGDLFGGTPTKVTPTRWGRVVAAALFVLALVGLWRFTPLAEITDPANMVESMVRIGGDNWMPITVSAAFVLGGLVVFPVTILIAVVGIMFDPLVAFAYAISGSLMSALVTFFVGYWLGRKPLRNLLGTRVNRISRAFARQGVLSVAALRMVPIAPFSVINVVAGASHIRPLDFFLGTLIGMAPGILVICYLGNQFASVLVNPSAAELLRLGLGLAAWIALLFALQFIASKLRRETRE